MIAAALLSVALCVPPPASADVDGILWAIAKVESNHKDSAVGDNGAAIGRYQIHRAYWQDAVQYDPSIGGKYEDCTNPAYARRVVIAYMSRYAKNWDVSTVAGIHNGGRLGYKSTATAKYRQKVERAYADHGTGR